MNNPAIMVSNYVVASSKSWHGKAFEKIRKQVPGNWVYVSTQNELDEAVRSISPRYIFFLHWNWMVPKEIFERHESVCFHMTDVPYGRGGSPLQNLIEAGHTETKVTALRMVGEMDAGPVYAKRPMSLDGRAEDIYLRAGDLCWEMIRWIIAETPVPKPQQGDVTKFIRRKPEQSKLPEQSDLEDLYNHIRMLDAPTYPLAFVEHGDFRLEFSHAKLMGSELVANVTFKKINIVKANGK